ncbi:MAG: S8 family serine peptidase, partial [Armatimonadota bacterium]
MYRLERRYARCLAVICTAAFASVLLLSVPAAAIKSESVLIGFRGKPNIGAVASLGARVVHAYELVPAIAAEVPSSKIPAIRRLSGVVYVEPDYPIYATGGAGTSVVLYSGVPGGLGTLFNPSTEVLPWGIERIGAPQVWLGTAGAPPNVGTGIAVGIIDTGIDYTHPDLADNYVLGYDFVNNDWDPLDDNGHGTHVAGTIAALDDGPNSGGANTG